MKQSKALLSILGIVFLFSVSFAYSTEERQAYNYAYQNGITTMNSISQADMGGNLTRIAMAKMLSNYAINILGLMPDTSKNCYFSDVSSSLDAQYDNGVTRACQLGLMGVGINQFYPNSKVTRAEFGTVLSRALNAKNTAKLAQMNSAEPYYYEHLRYLQGEGIMNNISNPGGLELRGRVMLMLMRSDKSYQPEEIEDDYPTVHSANKIDTTTRGIYTEGCDWTTQRLNEYNTYHDMPNKNWTDDAKFVNKALQDVRDNGENLVVNYINQANRVLDSAGLTKRDQCRYSLLIDELENQNGFFKSYKTENGKIVVGIDFFSYKEAITWDDMSPYGVWELKKNTSTKVRYYTLSNNVELEILNVDENGYTNERDFDHDRKYISNWNVRRNAFCNNEPVYNGEELRISEGEGGIFNRNDYGRLCTKNMLSEGYYLFFKFDATGNIDRISGLNYRLTNAN